MAPTFVLNQHRLGLERCALCAYAALLVLDLVRQRQPTTFSNNIVFGLDAATPLMV